MRNFLFRLIGILEIAGGLYGAAAMLRRLLPLGAHDSLAAALGFALFVFVLVAGVLLVEGHERGVMLSRWAQLIQVPLIASSALSYALHSGAFVNLYATVQATPRLGFDWHLGSQAFLLMVGGPGIARLGVNVLALGSWLVLRMR